MASYPKLLVHIGPGKTGSTSIQHALTEGRDHLRAQGVEWLGMMLEHCQNHPRFDWQCGLQPALLFEAMPAEEASEQIYRVLAEQMRQLSRSATRVAVWSHEAIFTHQARVGDALCRLLEDGVEVQILCYLRRHDRWAQSAYAQWGIRHKTYAGPVVPFSDWVQKRPVRFGTPLRYWNDTFGTALELRNFDATQDVVRDVMSAIGVSDYSSKRIYQTPPSTVLAAWAIYNSQFRDPVLPAQFQRLLNASGVQNASEGLPGCNRLLPSDADLHTVLQGAGDDLAYVNEVLRAKGQPELTTDDPARALEVPSEWEMIQFLVKTVFAWQEQTLRLRHRIEQLEGHRRG